MSSGTDGEIGSLGTGPMSYTREEIASLIAPIISEAGDPGEIGAFVVLTCDQSGRLSGWRTDCQAPEHVVGLLAQGLAAAANLIRIERAHCNHGTLHPRSGPETQTGAADTIPETGLEPE